MSTSEYSPTGLVRPPVRTPIPDQELIAGQQPFAGAGSVTSPQPGMPPAPIPGMSVLPFGNGVAPQQGITPVGSDFWANQTMMSPTGLTPPSPWNSAPTPQSDGDLNGTAILPGNTSPVDPGPAIGGVAPSGSPIVGSATPGSTIMGSAPSGSPILGGAPSYAPVVGSPEGGAAVNFGSDPRLSQYRGMLDKSAGDLANTDRRGMLGQLLADFDTQSAERDDNAFTAVGRRDAALGRLGSGMTSGALGTIARQSARDKGMFRNQLAADTIDKEIGDRFSKTNLFRGLAGDEYGYGRGERDEARGERGYRDSRGDRFRDEVRGERSYFDNRGDQYRDEARGERGYGDNRGDRYRDEARGERAYGDDFGSRYRNEARGERGYFDNRGDQYRDENRGERSWRYNAGRDAIGDSRANRNEYRGERAYQDDREAYDTDRRIQERKLSDDLTGTAFNRAQDRYSAGRYGNPANYIEGAAGNAQDQSNGTMQALMKFLEEYGNSKGSR